MRLLQLLLLPSLHALTTASELKSSYPVAVQINQTTIRGQYNASLGVETFLGIPYASSQRFRRATPVEYSSNDTVDASRFGVACPQLPSSGPLGVDYGVYGVAEDCTSLNIFRPQGTAANASLPVMVWVHGGQLTVGAASHFPGHELVKFSACIGMPIIQIGINYRLAVWGFLGGTVPSAKGAQNLGLYDQREALRWIQSWIGSFGGDPKKVTVFGQSSGAISLSYHALTVSTDLFRGAIFESGSTTSVAVVDAPYYNTVYDGMVELSGCSSASDSFECMRTADYEVLYNASVALAAYKETYGTRVWGVTIDGEIIPDAPSTLTDEGKIAPIPFIQGDVRDEGTTFVYPNTIDNITALWDFLQQNYHNFNVSLFTNDTAKAQLEALYPEDPALGSPYGTGNETFFGAQFKRAASLYGVSDVHFQAPRRRYLEAAITRGIPAWSYIWSQQPPGAEEWEGVYHTSEIPYVFLNEGPVRQRDFALQTQTAAHWISFAYNLDPTRPNYAAWPPYGTEKNTMNFTTAGSSVVKDDYRDEQTGYLLSIAYQLVPARIDTRQG
ncbi:alpha/beta-hydrolase [Schizophyllum commune Tattone D]|nr:alpha/beta-hydrolase [Schizophyllum commune Tattone D]